MPAYPFISVFIAQYVLYLTEYKVKIIRIFAIIIGVIATIVSLVLFLTVLTSWINPVTLLASMTKNTTGLVQFSELWQSMHFSLLLSVLLLVVLLCSIYILLKSFRKRLYLKTLYATVGVYLAIFLVVDGLYLHAYKDAVSVLPIAQKLQAQYPISKDNLFVMNNLLKYENMYGLNFYLHNDFRNFEKESPAEGYFLIGNNDFKQVVQIYKSSYNFNFLEEFPNRARDGERVIQLYFFKKK